MADDAFVFPTSFAQERLWFLDQLVPNNAFYNIDTALRLSFRVDREALERSVGEIVRRHETLRTTFKSVDGLPVQVVAPALQLHLPLVDLSETGRRFPIAAWRRDRCRTTTGSSTSPLT